MAFVNGFVADCRAKGLCPCETDEPIIASILKELVANGPRLPDDTYELLLNLLCLLELRARSGADKPQYTVH
jgi:hypothetical protein